MTEAIVVMSGGADSCICLFEAIERWGKENIEVITFTYGQRHEREVEQAQKICKMLDIPQIIIPLSGWDKIRGSALFETNSEITINEQTGLPTSFVPGRNVIFLTYAAAYAYTKNCHNLVTGVCQTDYSGYCDCRDSSIKALQGALTLCLGYDIYIHTPLMWLTKAESIELAIKNGAISYLKHTQTCYNNKRPACGLCPACKLRIQGFKDAKTQDPLEYEIDIDWTDCAMMASANGSLIEDENE